MVFHLQTGRFLKDELSIYCNAFLVGLQMELFWLIHGVILVDSFISPVYWFVEPSKGKLAWFVEPSKDRRTKQGKGKLAWFVEASKGKLA